MRGWVSNLAGGAWVNIVALVTFCTRESAGALVVAVFSLFFLLNVTLRK